MGCYVRVGLNQYDLPAAVGTYDLLEAVAVAIAQGASFWLVLENAAGRHRFWLSPALPLELLDDLDYSGPVRKERVDVLVRAAVEAGQMHAGLAFADDDAFREGMRIARERDAAEREADDSRE